MSVKEFFVSEPYEVKLIKKSSFKRVRTNTQTKTKYYRTIKKWTKKDWVQNGNLGNKKGVYIYLWDDKPIYVGKTDAQKGFQNECFHTHKTGNSKRKEDGVLTRFLKLINAQRINKKKLKIQFIYCTCKKGGSVDNIVRDIERYLIRKYMNYATYCMNTQDTKPKWSIPGFDGESFYDIDKKTKKNISYLNKAFCVD